jgi:predicted GNAT family acetyltransferase
LDPRFVKAVIREGEIISFIVGIPNMSEGIKKAKGHILPFGIFQILRAAKKTKQLDLLLGAVKDEYRGRGLDVMMGFKTLESAKQAGFEFLDSHHELESNTKMRAEMERMGGKVYKKFRVFQKQL